MAENITLNNVATFVNDASAVNTVNNNNSTIVNAFADVLSRSGVGPNQMTSTLDMNNQQIINLPFPTTLNSPARLQDVTNAQNITIVTATTGTSGHTVPFLDGANTWSNTQTINMNTGIGQGLTINETVVGTNAGGITTNTITAGDTSNTGGNFSTLLNIQQTAGTSASSGGKIGLASTTVLTSASSNTNTNRTYTGMLAVGTASSADNGTGVTSGNSAGLFSGITAQGNAGNGATNLFGVNAANLQVSMATGSSAWSKSGLIVSSLPNDAVNGSGINTMLWCYNETGSTAKWTNALLVDNQGGAGVFPIATTGTIFKVGAGSVATGIDFNSVTFSGSAFQSPGFNVTNSGGINTGSPAISSGNLTFNGQTSGFLTVSSNATATLLTISSPVQFGIIGTFPGTITLAGQTSGSTILSCSATGSNLQLGAGNVLISSNGNITTNAGIAVGASTGIVAGGDATHAYFMSAGSLALYYGSGVPTLTAAQGSLYIRTDGSSTSTRLYVNTTGSNVWTNFTSAA